MVGVIHGVVEGLVIVVVWILAGLLLHAAVLGWMDRRPKDAKPCPHGWLRWDDCPDCRH